MRLTRLLLFIPALLLAVSCSDDDTPTSGMPGNGDSDPPSGDDNPTYTLETEVIPQDGGSILPGTGEFDEGEEIDLTATPESEWLFVEWGGNLDGSENPATLTVDADLNVQAIFELRTYPLTVEIVGQGAVTEEIVQQPADSEYESGTVVKLTAQASSDWEFEEWAGIGDADVTDPVVTVTVDKAKHVIALFAEIDDPEDTEDPEEPACDETVTLNSLQPGDSQTVSFPQACGAELPGDDGAVYRVSLMSRENPTAGSLIPSLDGGLRLSAEWDGEQISGLASTNRTADHSRSAGSGDLLIDPDLLELMRTTSETHYRLNEEARERFDGTQANTAPISPAIRLAEESDPEPEKERTFFANNPSGGERLQIEAELRKAGDHLLYYQDKEIDENDQVSDEYLENMFDYYDQHGRPVIEEAFGGLGPDVTVHDFADGPRPAYDIGRDARVIILELPDAKMLSGTAAYVYSCDRLPRPENLADDSSLRPCSDSNEAEITFTLGPDMDSTQERSYYKGLIIHEVKHVSSHGYYIYADRGFNNSWIEEGTAEAAMELAGRRAAGFADDQMVTANDILPPNTTGRYGIFAMHFRAHEFLDNIPQTTLFGSPWTDSSNNHYYGGAWLFHRYLADHHSDGDVAGFFREMNTEAPGVETLESSTGQSIQELLDGFMTAVQIEGYPLAWQNSPHRFESYDMDDIDEGIASGTGREPAWPWLHDAMPYDDETWEFPDIYHGTPLSFEFQAQGGEPLLLELTRDDGEPIDPNDGVALVITRIE